MMDRSTLYRTLVFYLTPVLAISAAAWLVTRPVSTDARETLEEKNAHLWRAALGTSGTPMPVATTIGPVRVSPFATPAMPAPFSVAPQATKFTSGNVQITFNADRNTVEKREIASMFVRWIKAQSESPGARMKLYAPDARLHLSTNEVSGREQLLAFFASNSTPAISDASLDQIEPVAPKNSSIYEVIASLWRGNNGEKPSDYRLLWHKQNGRWLIREEWQSATSTTPMNAATSPPSTPSFRTLPDDSAQFAARVAQTPNDSDRRALLARYEEWKATHSGPVEPYIALYATNAQIHTGLYSLNGNGQRSIEVTTRDQLQTLAEQARSSKTYDRVTDASPPQIAIENGGAEIRAQNIYADSGTGGSRAGKRRLLWRWQWGSWRIVEDWFPGTHQDRPLSKNVVAVAPFATATPTSADREAILRLFQKWKNYQSAFGDYSDVYFPHFQSRWQENAATLERTSRLAQMRALAARGHPESYQETAKPRITITKNQAELRVPAQWSSFSDGRLATNPTVLSIDLILTCRKQNNQWLVAKEERLHFSGGNFNLSWKESDPVWAR